MMILCDQGTRPGTSPGPRPCSKPAVQFWLCYSNTVKGVTWTLACCEQHRMALEPPPGTTYNDGSHEITEEEFHVAQVMQS